MRLFTLKHFRDFIYADGSAPSMETLRDRNRKRMIAGGFVDECGRHYVDMDEHDRKHQVVKTLLDKQAQLAAAPELAGLI